MDEIQFDYQDLVSPEIYTERVAKIDFYNVGSNTMLLRDLIKNRRQMFLIIGFVLLISARLQAYEPNLEHVDLQETRWNKTNAKLEALLESIEKTDFNLEVINPSLYVTNTLWANIQDYLIPYDHPAKIKLDEIFSASRALYNMHSMIAAGFEAAKPQHHSQIIVTRHPELRGYVIKAYLDEQEYHSGKPEYYFWIKRIIGSRLIKNLIESHKYEHLIKVPKKWIYLLPDEPSPPDGSLRKMFILVEEDMDIYPDKRNEKLWGSSAVTKELLKALFTITTELGLFDCAKPANCPIAKDGKVALIDTQSYFAKRVKYHKLTPYLSPSMKRYWLKLTAKSEDK